MVRFAAFLPLLAHLGLVEGQTASTVIPSSGPFVESVVPHMEGYVASEMSQAGMGQIVKYNNDGTRDMDFAAQSIAGNIGLAISSDEMKLFSAQMNGVREYDISAEGLTEARFFDVSEHSATVNGLCLSPDGQWLYATEAGWTFSQTTYQIERKETSAFLFAIDLQSGAVTSLLPTMTDDHSPNGCAVDPNNQDVVYMATIWHGVTAWNRVEGNVPISFGANIVTNTRAEMNNRWGDGIVFWEDHLYVSSFGLDMSAGAFAGNLWRCDISGSEDCESVLSTRGADIQLDTRDSNQAYVLLPEMDMVAGQVRRFPLPMPDADGNAGTDDSGNTGTGDSKAFQFGISGLVSAVVAMQQFF